MGLLKGQDEIMNDGDCFQVLDKIFAKQLKYLKNIYLMLRKFIEKSNSFYVKVIINW